MNADNYQVLTYPITAVVAGLDATTPRWGIILGGVEQGGVFCIYTFDLLICPRELKAIQDSQQYVESNHLSKY